MAAMHFAQSASLRHEPRRPIWWFHSRTRTLDRLSHPRRPGHVASHRAATLEAPDPHTSGGWEHPPADLESRARDETRFRQPTPAAQSRPDIELENYPAGVRRRRTIRAADSLQNNSPPP